jgi:hypothetical protein
MEDDSGGFTMPKGMWSWQCPNCMALIGDRSVLFSASAEKGITVKTVATDKCIICGHEGLELRSFDTILDEWATKPNVVVNNG